MRETDHLSINLFRLSSSRWRRTRPWAALDRRWLRCNSTSRRHLEFRFLFCYRITANLPIYLTLLLQRSYSCHHEGDLIFSFPTGRPRARDRVRHRGVGRGEERRGDDARGEGELIQFYLLPKFLAKKLLRLACTERVSRERWNNR